MKQIALIGIGNCGSQAVALAEEKYPELFDCVYINTSESDLGMVNSESLKIKIGENDEVYGSGKNRNKMKAFLREDIKKVLTNEDLIECIRDKKYVFIISSCAGGTGSGASPAMFEMLRTRFVDPQFVLVGVLPKLQDSMSDQGNSLEYLNELYETLSGSVRLEEPYSMHCFLEFTAVTDGHIRIKGRIHNKKGIGYGHELIFENEVDQTYLRGFAKTLFADYGKYTE